MQDSRILSAFQELPDAQAPSARRVLAAPQAALADAPAAQAQPLVFDACDVGVILRAVVYVEAAVLAGALLMAETLPMALLRFAVVTCGALPATLLWLVTACALKKPLATLARPWQYAFGVGLGALMGMLAGSLLVLAGMMEQLPTLGCALAGGLLAATVVAWLVWRARARAPAAATARLAELQARIRPHFLFNTLNTAIALVRDEPAQAEAILEDLSDLFRHALREQGEAATLDDELALARRYLAIEQIRFGPRLQLEWALDAAAGKARLPPLLLQPLVENAVKHGVEPSASGAQVRISTQKRGTRVVIKVTNTVPAGHGEKGHGLALANVRDRLGLLHDLRGNFRTARVGDVFQARIELPMPDA